MSSLSKAVRRSCSIPASGGEGEMRRIPVQIWAVADSKFPWYASKHTIKMDATSAVLKS
jgi:hypothetical protein